MISSLFGLLYLSAMHRMCILADAIVSATHAINQLSDCLLKVIFTVRFLDTF